MRTAGRPPRPPPPVRIGVDGGPGPNLEHMQPASVSQPPVADPEGARCPVPHVAAAAAAAGGCPIDHGAQRVVQRSRADEIVRSLLRIKERPAHVTDAVAYNTFRRSMLISAVRCTLTYVVFPFLLPAASFAAGVGPVLGIAIGLLAMTCDVFTIRRFFQVDHRWRWPVSIVAFGVICLLSVLLVQDIVHLAG